MASGNGRLKLTYWAGWIIAIAAFAYKAFTFTSAGLAVANRIRVAPYQLLETSGLLFLICVAQAAYSLADKKTRSG
jgi:hypothetical protein